MIALGTCIASTLATARSKPHETHLISECDIYAALLRRRSGERRRRSTLKFFDRGGIRIEIGFDAFTHGSDFAIHGALARSRDPLRRGNNPVRSVASID